jgi:hypothetical protein
MRAEAFITPYPIPPPQGGREHENAPLLPLPPCGGGMGWGVATDSV